MVEQTPTNQNLEANNSINRLVDAVAGITTQQRPQAATMLKPVSTNTLIFDGKNEKFELFEDLFHTMLKMQPEMTEAMETNNFHAHLRKEALQTFRNISAVNKKTLDDVLIVFRRKNVKPESQVTLTGRSLVLKLTLYSDFITGLISVIPGNCGRYSRSKTTEILTTLTPSISLLEVLIILAHFFRSDQCSSFQYEVDRNLFSNKNCENNRNW